MEIDIKIKLEDADIALLIKSLFEIFKKFPQDNININIDPNTKPPPPVQIVPLKDIKDFTYPTEQTDGITANDKVYHTDTPTNKEKLYYSDGSSVREIENQKKTKEE